MQRGSILLLGLLLAGAIAAAWALSVKDINPVAWQRQANPGALSKAHATLGKDCAACHTPAQGPDDAKCIACHANDTTLLQRQPTAFHAEIGNCSQCHVEHRGRGANLREMDHEALARISLKQLGSQHSTANLEKQILHWLDKHPSRIAPTPNHPETSPLEATLVCSTCHATKQPHSGLFGENCASCHGTQRWTIPRFQHPSPRSTECAQCHQAPPSHYMMHFEMVSKKIAKPAVTGAAASHEGATVSQCYVCHETTSWNDIEGVGWYKHH